LCCLACKRVGSQQLESNLAVHFLFYVYV
jgi:hypothetical protein